MKSDSPIPSDTRRDFVKKSFAASIVAAQPTLLSGLIRAQGGGGGGTTATGWDTTEPNTTNETTITETTSWETTAGASTSFDLVGSAIAAGEDIEFDGDKYGQLENDWPVGDIYCYKLKFWASSIDDENTPHGDPLKIEIAGELYRIGSMSQFKTPRFGLQCEVVNQSNGTISAQRTGPHETELFAAPAGSIVYLREDPEDEQSEIIAKYILNPNLKILDLDVKTEPENNPPTKAILSGKVRFWTNVRKEVKDSSGEFVEVDPYDPDTDPDYPGGDDVNPFQVTIYSHVHVSQD